MEKLVKCVLGVLFVTTTAWAGADRKLTVSAFNIRYYGVGGTMAGTSAQEQRDPYLKEFIKTKIPTSDVMSFEEITDVERLKTLMPAGWECLSYDSTFENHQHVVLCHSGNYTFVKEPTDDNYLIDEVSFDGGKSRPALTAIVADKQGNQILRVVAVHLKAFPEESARRQQQAHIISDYLKHVSNPNLPVVITGDFNTFPSNLTGETKDDTELLSDAFKDDNLTYAPHPAVATFRKPQGERSKFDHFWISKSLRPIGTVRVFDVCNQQNAQQAQQAPVNQTPVQQTPVQQTPVGQNTSAQAGSYYDIGFYYRNVSDHCPVTLTVAY